MSENKQPVQDLGIEAARAMSKVEDDICLYYDEVYGEEETIEFLRKSLQQARDARNAFFSHPDWIDQSIPLPDRIYSK